MGGGAGNVMRTALRPLYSAGSTFTLRVSRSCTPESENVCIFEACACMQEHARVSATIISVAGKHFFRSLPPFGVMILPFRPTIGSRSALGSSIVILSCACWGQFKSPVQCPPLHTCRHLYSMGNPGERERDSWMIPNAVPG